MIMGLVILVIPYFISGLFELVMVLSRNVQGHLKGRCTLHGSTDEVI